MSIVAAVAAGLWLGRAHSDEALPEQPADVVAEVAKILSGISVVPSVTHLPGYDRSCGPGHGCVFGKRWNDPDNHSGCDTRNLVLASELIDVVFKPGTRNCKVITGWVIDPYSGNRVELTQIEIDHVVPLRRAYDSGAANWDLLQRRRFANDHANLLAVSRTQNRSKSDSGPGMWMPPDPASRCGYGLRYLKIVSAYDLPIDAADQRAVMRACGIGVDRDGRYQIEGAGQ